MKYTAVHTGRRGLTLMELLVSVAILSGILLAFNVIIVQSQRVVSASTRTMRSNQAATAIAQVLRTDVRQASQKALLCITQDPADGSPRLILVNQGATQSLTTDVAGSASLIVYGSSDNQAAGRKDQVLWRQGWVVRRYNNDPADKFRFDVLNKDMGEVEALPRAVNNSHLMPDTQDLGEYVSNDVLGGLSPGAGPAAIKIPPDSLDDINGLWQCLSAGTKALSIMWTDGKTDAQNNLLWYGIDYTIDSGTGVVTYVAIGKAEVDGQTADSWWNTTMFHRKPDGKPYIQYDADAIPADMVYLYRALWTHHNQNNWPKAIRFRFELDSTADWKKALPEGLYTYEIICPLGG